MAGYDEDVLAPDVCFGVYFFVDGMAERLRARQVREPVLAAWGIGEEGGKVLLHPMAGSKEDTETVRAFFQDMRGRRGN